MIKVDIPGFGKLTLKYLVLDYNGTIAEDGVLIKGIKELLIQLSAVLNIHVVTADTFGFAASQLKTIPCTLKILDKKDQKDAKLEYVNNLGNSYTASIGNGRNDSLMLKASALGIAVIMAEGASAETLMSADIVSKGIIHALNLFTHTKRLKATLRS